MMLSVQVSLSTSPFALSLSKGMRGNDRLSPNGIQHG